jgi:hypothetical protein
MPRILFAQTDAPTPLPQIATPRSTFPGGHGLREREHIIRIVIIFAQVMCPEIDDLVSRFAKLAEQLLLQTKSTVIGGDPNAHMLFLMLLVLTRSAAHYQHIHSQAALVRVALLEAITLMSSFRELTNDLAPSS